MCGIMGYVGPRPAVEVLIGGLRRLEYRGYDSAGIALGMAQGIHLVKRAGPLRVLWEELEQNPPPPAGMGIGHTRWATHGGVSDENAHPHLDCHERIAVVHNGIIENAAALRIELESRGHRLRSETDSELVAHLLEEAPGDLLHRLQAVANRCEGAYALLAFDLADPNRLCAVRRTSPIAIGFTENEVFVASGAIALAPWLKRCIYLDDGEMADLRPGHADIFRLHDLAPVQKAFHEVSVSGDLPDAGRHKLFFRKELFEQPAAWRSVMQGRLDEAGSVDLSDTGLTHETLSAVQRVLFLAMGSSLHASQMAVERLQQFAQLPAEAHLSSEFRDTRTFLEPSTLVVAVSQSGETIDTLAALRHARALGATVVGLVNAPGSTIARESDYVFDLRAGAEISVASTKAFTTQAVALDLLASALAAAHGRGPNIESLSALRAAPTIAEDFLEEFRLPNDLVERCAQAPGVIFLGRGQDLSLAREGSLKLKELSYVWSEAFAAGELKHGPLALVDATVPVIVCATDSRHAVKLRNSLAEATARGAYGVSIGADLNATMHIALPIHDATAAYLIGTLPLQLLAVAVAETRGCTIDQPRNLAKSVTVE
ncbi:MAG: glutamine--fructose-6-phosphate transaminase (isomerizing) [Thermaerobacter sp.]|nr:glutamine--fructose-6-phosphate transaminase (isomerizing) [Thermaerobacter sp.]